MGGGATPTLSHPRSLRRHKGTRPHYREEEGADMPESLRTCDVVWHDGRQVVVCRRRATVAIGYRGGPPSIHRCEQHANDFLRAAAQNGWAVASSGAKWPIG